MKNWFNNNFKTLIIAAFLIPILTVAVVSISHVTEWYGISNPVSWAVYLSIGIEIAALSALAAISANMGSKVYFPFAIVTLIQFIGNIFFAYTYIDIDSKQFKDWVDLVSPLVESMGVDNNDYVGHKRFLALFAGGMLPIISLSFLHMLVKFIEENKIIPTESNVNDEIINKVDAKEIISEVSRLRLSDDDLEILTKHLENPPKPNETLTKAAERYKETIKEEEPTTLDNTGFKEYYNSLEHNNVEEEPYVNDDFETKEEVQDFSTIETETTNIFQEEPTIEEERQNFSIIDPNEVDIFQQEEPKPTEQDVWNDELEEQFWNEQPTEPFATPEEVEEFSVDVVKIDETLNEVNSELDGQVTMAPQYDLEVINDEPVYQSEQKEIDEANDILDNIEEPKIEMVIPETVQPEEIEVIEPEIVVVTQPEEIEVIEPEVVETKEEETPSEDEGIKKNS
jgi:hypothetical protein